MLTVSDLISELDLKIIAGHEKGGLAREISEPGLRVPGLELAGYFQFYTGNRILLLGPQEISFLNQFTPQKLRKSLENLYLREFPCLICCGEISPPPALLEFAQKSGRPLMFHPDDPNKISFKLSNYLHLKFVPKKVIHGVLIEVYGVGILILGPSATGKSESALELIKRGHRLIADDSVELVRVNETTLIGLSNSIIGHHMEIRGLGIIDIAKLFGVAATATEKRVDLITYFERWDDKKEYDRLGLEEDFTEILQVKIPNKTIPVRAGRNLAILVETAAMDFNLKKLGIHSARSFSRLLRFHIHSNDVNQK